MDTSFKVNQDNRVLYKFYEKPTCSNLTAQQRTAMGEDSKVQILSNDLIRRLKNNSEDLGAGAKRKIVDQYAKKLRTSGWSMEQTRRIITNGIKGYESMRRRCVEQGKRLHKSSEESKGARTRKKLLGKSNWFRSNKSNKQQEQEDSLK